MRAQEGLHRQTTGTWPSLVYLWYGTFHVAEALDEPYRAFGLAYFHILHSRVDYEFQNNKNLKLISMYHMQYGDHSF